MTLIVLKLVKNKFSLQIFATGSSQGLLEEVRAVMEQAKASLAS
jgi:hypothetical protein